MKNQRKKKFLKKLSNRIKTYLLMMGNRLVWFRTSEVVYSQQKRRSLNNDFQCNCSILSYIHLIEGGFNRFPCCNRCIWIRGIQNAKFIWSKLVKFNKKYRLISINLSVQFCDFLRQACLYKPKTDKNDIFSFCNSCE